MQASELRRHLEVKVEQAEVCPFPFPHIIIEDFFPADVYERILAFNLFQWNAGREWISKRDMLLNKNTPSYDHRLQINFQSGDAYEGPAGAREFWSGLAQTFLADDWFPRLVYRKYPEYFDLRFGEAVHDDAFWPRIDKQLFLQRHIPDYHIGPHTDIAPRVFACIFSFADRPGYEEYGTQLMRHRDPNKRCWGDRHHDPDDFEVVKSAPYKPNNFLLFFKTRQSFHGVRPHHLARRPQPALRHAVPVPRAVGRRVRGSLEARPDGAQSRQLACQGGGEPGRRDGFGRQGRARCRASRDRSADAA